MSHNFFVYCIALLSITLIQCSDVDCLCTDNYQPVCGSDGVLYFNSCEAACAGVEFSPGICPSINEATIVYLGDLQNSGCGWVLKIENESAPNIYLSGDIPNTLKIQDLMVEITYYSSDVLRDCLHETTTLTIISNIEIISILKK